MRDALRDFRDLAVKVLDTLLREKWSQGRAPLPVLLGVGGAESGFGDAEAVLELARLVHRLGRRARAVDLVPEFRIVDMQLIRVNAHYRAVSFVHLLHLPGELATAALREQIIPDLIPMSCRRQLGTGKRSKRTEIEPIYDQRNAVS